MEVRRMTSKEYLRQVSVRIRKLPPEEYESVMSFYTEYFAEAGEEKAQEIMASLGSPAQLAASIRADFAVRGLSSEEGDYTPKVKTGISAVWFAILGVFAAPIAIPIAIAIAAVAFAVVIAIGSVLLSLVVTAIAVTISGVGAFVAGIVLIPQSIATALFYIGSGLACTAFGLLFGLGVTLLSRLAFSGLAKKFNGIRTRRQEKKMRKLEVKLNERER
jgi:uncharacterized membrane protein